VSRRRAGRIATVARNVGIIALALGSAPRASAQQLLVGAERDYVLYCQGCHGADGSGIEHRVPALRESIARLMQTQDGREFLLRVPGAANSALSDQALAAVVNWLVTRFDATSSVQRAEFSAAEVAAARRRPLVGVHRARLTISSRLTAAGFVPPDDY
jgi:mono/diheme cytochrome c family protein